MDDNNSKKIEELDLTLSLRCGGSKETPTPNPSLLPLSRSQTNSSLMQMQMLCPNLSLNLSLTSFSNNNNNNTNLSLASSNHNTNPPTVAADADKNVFAVTPSLRCSSRYSCARPSKRKRENFPAPFPWATNQRATVHTQQYLLVNNVHIIKGKVHCNKCNQEFELGLNLEEKLADICNLIKNEVDNWHTRAPPEWLNPVYPKCIRCGPKFSTKPILGKHKEEISWLFLLLSQMLGCCTLHHLKYFCKHNDIHRTGAKDRLLYLTYINLVKQLLPDFSID